MEIGTEAAQFPEKEYINEIFVAVYTVPIINAGFTGRYEAAGRPERDGGRLTRRGRR